MKAEWGRRRVAVVLAALLLCGCGLAEGGREPARPFTASGFLGVDLGRTVGDICAGHPDFTPVTGTGEVTVSWQRSDWTFRDGVLVEIAPLDGGRTMDGVTVDSSVREAIDLYGPPLEVTVNPDESDTVVFRPTPDASVAYRMRVLDYVPPITTFAGILNNSSGTIPAITLAAR